MMAPYFAHLRQTWYVYLVLAAIWISALVRVLVDPTPWLPILFNVTPSLPYKVVVIDYGAKDPHRGDYIVYAFEGDAVRYFPGLRRQPLFKQVTGVAGDVVTVSERHVYINGRDVGYAKTHTVTRLPLQPIAPTVIPPGYFYVAGQSPDSFDSRYAISGLVARRQIVGRVTPIL
ncbi:conjugative transfer signal peptidase TraF [Duganella vulcania]|uniref:Signal peptidase I n=1 Tax=Duganella vulcania TaxID=2692166 RepID=A0A845GTB2_9BURK|nr:conjugative transfer signal peptidase TraF [Duganella vulcania]MYM95917.1 conjugative transfer signal peptidase TraF [Duganella vulcania]